MKIARYLAYGVIGGLAYAFVSFYLVTPCLKGNWVEIAYFGFQGFLYAGIFLLLKARILRNSASEIAPYGIIGAISGLVSCTYYVFATYYSAVLSAKAKGIIVPPEMRYGILLQLAQYCVGCLVLGSFVGILIGYKGRLRN